MLLVGGNTIFFLVNYKHKLNMQFGNSFINIVLVLHFLYIIQIFKKNHFYLVT